MKFEQIQTTGIAGLPITCGHLVCDTEYTMRLNNIGLLKSDYTFQMIIKSKENETIIVQTNSISFNLYSTTTWNRVSKTFTFTSIPSNKFIEIVFPVGEYWFYHIKLEEGNKETDHTYAPEDTDENFKEVKSEYTQLKDGFYWLVKDGDSASTFTLTPRVAELVANDINLKGLITFSGLGTDAKKQITDAQQTAYDASESAKNANNAITNNKVNWDSGYKWASNNGVALESMIKKWTDGAVSDTTTINGGWIKTNTITSLQIATDAIMSNNYNPDESGNVTEGSFLNLADGTFNSANFSWDKYGNIFATGTAQIGGLYFNRQEDGSYYISNNKNVNTFDIAKKTSYGFYLGDDGFSIGSLSIDNITNNETEINILNECDGIVYNPTTGKFEDYCNGQILNRIIRAIPERVGEYIPAENPNGYEPMPNYLYPSLIIGYYGSYNYINTTKKQDGRFIPQTIQFEYDEGNIPGTNILFKPYEGQTIISALNDVYIRSREVNLEGTLINVNSKTKESTAINLYSNNNVKMTIRSNGVNTHMDFIGGSLYVFDNDMFLTQGKSYQLYGGGKLYYDASIGNLAINKNLTLNRDGETTVIDMYSNKSHKYIRSSKDNDHMDFVGASLYTFDKPVFIGESSYLKFYGEATIKFDDTNGDFISNKNIKINKSGNTTQVSMYSNKTNKIIRSNSENDHLDFIGGSLYTFDNSLFLADKKNIQFYGGATISYNSTDGIKFNSSITATNGESSVCIYMPSGGKNIYIRSNGSNGHLDFLGATYYYFDANTSVSSDERVKKDFISIDKWEKFFDLINPIGYKFKIGDNKYHLGFKAQQIKSALEESCLSENDFSGLVSMEYNHEDYDEEHQNMYKESGVVDGDKIYALAYDEFIALNTHEIQKLKQENTELKNRLDELERKIL